MDALRRITSRPQAEPYRTRNLEYSQEIHTDENGLLRFSPNDVENPKEWSTARRWYITIVSILLVMNASMASSSPSGCLPSIAEGLNTSLEVSKFTVTMFLLRFCAGPTLWAPLSEYYGRKPIFTGTFLCHVAFTCLCAFAPNIEALLVDRFLCGTSVGGILTNVPGIFVDLWPPIERGNCMSLFTVGLQLGPAIGPITSGFYQLKLDWRWNFYQLLWIAVFSVLFLPTIPETLPSRALLAKAKRVRKAKIPGYENVQAPIEVEDRSLLVIFKVTLSRPWLILFDPIFGLIAIYITIVYALLYQLFTLYPIIFIQKRGWNAGVGELPLLGVMVGSIIGGLYVYWDSVRQRKRLAAGHQHRPEDALPVGMTGAVLLPIAMFWISWSGEYNSVHWIVPTLAGVFLSGAIVIIFVAYLTYLSESYLMYAASAQAANQIIRSAVAAAAPLYTEQMFSAMGVAGGGSLIAGIAVLLSPIPFVFYKYGESIRVKSRFAPTPERISKDRNQEAQSDLPDGVEDRVSDAKEQSGKRPKEVEEAASDRHSSCSDTKYEERDVIEKGEKGEEL